MKLLELIIIILSLKKIIIINRKVVLKKISKDNNNIIFKCLKKNLSKNLHRINFSIIILSQLLVVLFIKFKSKIYFLMIFESGKYFLTFEKPFLISIKIYI